MGEITDKERVILNQFKDNLSDLDLESNIYLKDMQLIRWLRARDMNLQKAEEMLRNCLEHRSEQHLENILQRSISEKLSSEFPFEICGTDKEGNILIHIPYGKMDLKRGVKEMGKEGSREMACYYIEKTFQTALANSSDEMVMKRCSPIIDFKDLSYFQFASVEVLDLILYSLKIFEQQYPEILATGFMINTPALWSVLWSMTKTFLHQRTQDKIVLTGCEPEKITEILLKYIDKDQLPEKYGGTVILKYPEPRKINDPNEKDDCVIANNKSFFGMFT